MPIRFKMIYPALRWLLVIALVAPSLVPAGYMLQRNEQTNAVEMTFCHGVSRQANPLETASHSSNPLEQHDDQEQSGDHDTSLEICPFAVAGAAVLETPASLVSTNPGHTYAAEPLLTRADSLAPGQLNARGPPLTS
ncbi:MAG: hypothetical protein ISP91_08135 [Pseudomonadales bacterium]|nr:hypothetical protein [Pseudomonadales bacterium]